MPCNSDYMEASGWEREISQVACLLDELNGKAWSKESWGGYHPRVYCCGVTKETGDEMVSRLCASLRKRDVSKCSLEMQIWWRDHQLADLDRQAKEAIAQQAEREKQKALSKLTDYERQLLGI